MDLAGHMRFGPDAYYIERPARNPWAVPDYSIVDESSLDDAHKAIKRFVQTLTLSMLLINELFLCFLFLFF